MPDKMVDRRKTDRYSFPANIRFDISSGVSQVLSKAVAANVSSEGVGLYLFEKIERGQEITISNHHPVIKGRARVQWITELEPSFYMAGLKFL